MYLIRWRQCLVSALLAESQFCQQEGSTDMDGLENVISVLDYVLDTKRKRHIMGGILLSVSFLFGGLAITVMTIRNEEEEDEQ
nr:hypothetical protein [Odoribacter splanchnicus]